MFKRIVIRIIDGDTFEVSPNWHWRGLSGSKVRIRSYDAPELDEPGGSEARVELAYRILGGQVMLEPHTIHGERLVCDVWEGGSLVLLNEKRNEAADLQPGGRHGNPLGQPPSKFWGGSATREPTPTERVARIDLPMSPATKENSGKLGCGVASLMEDFWAGDGSGKPARNDLEALMGLPMLPNTEED